MGTFKAVEVVGALSMKFFCSLENACSGLVAALLRHEATWASDSRVSGGLECACRVSRHFGSPTRPSGAPTPILNQSTPEPGGFGPFWRGKGSYARFKVLGLGVGQLAGCSIYKTATQS